MIKKELPNIVFMGPPGVGKGTTANLIAQKTGIKHLSTGSIFRETIANKTPLGLKLAKYVENGLYVPDEVTNQIVKEKLESLMHQNQKVILDGYPRTIEQVHFLNKIEGFKYKVIELNASNDLIMQRLNGRRFCPNCGKNYNIFSLPSQKDTLCENCDSVLQMRKDDSIENIKIRQQIYKDSTAPLLDYFKEHNNLQIFDATGSPDFVTQQILDWLNKE
ncbi:nucleoside monophosphate kinase [Mycoplasma sp. 744]|uniref:adenylate kinase family protein n=1 Tax=unclassified Mycoplasma TaxID=2683645 RepID=UPI00211C18E7|nr:MULTISPECIES: nucleoside monophosphate kinase [unclassified Mycoplasma]MEA4115672.1 nucleoside monophosphate kinase [Mycoplasma sp. 744]UUM19098.1 nucleoside monophosphate kinase [Mycoplasma sp. 1018B]